MKKLTILFTLLLLSAGLAQADCVFTYTATEKLESQFEKIRSGTKPKSHDFSNGKGTVTFRADDITRIGNNAFYQCSALQSITLPASVTTIESQAFYQCDALQSIDLSHVTTIGVSVFEKCSALQSIDLSHVTTIGNNVFLNCTSLTDVTVAWTEATKIPAINKFLFGNIANGQGPIGATLHVPAGTQAIYKAAANWQDFGTIDDPATALAEAKAAAIAEIEQMATDAKAAIDAASTYPAADATKTNYKNEIDATVSGATYAINNATSKGAIDEELLQTTTDINYVKTEALAEIAKINVLAKAKADAVELIQTARQGIQNTEINTLIDNGVDAIRDATTEQQVEEVKLQIMTIITSFKIGIEEGDAAGYARGYTEGTTAGYAQGKEEGFAEGKAAGLAEAQAALPTDAQDAAGAVVIITKGDKTLKLVNPDSVEYDKQE